jgi:hypothetical protein
MGIIPAVVNAHNDRVAIRITPVNKVGYDMPVCHKIGTPRLLRDDKRAAGSASIIWTNAENAHYAGGGVVYIKSGKSRNRCAYDKHGSSK